MNHSIIHTFNHLEKFASAFSGIKSLHEMISTTERVLADVYAIREPKLYLLDQEDHLLKLFDTTGFKLETKILAADHSFAQEIHRVFETKKPSFIANAELDCSEPLGSIPSTLCRSQLFLPILNGDIIVGVINISDQAPYKYQDEEIAVLSFICNMTGAMYANLINQELLTKAKDEITNLSKLVTESPNPVLRISHSNILLYANKASSDMLQSLGLKIGEYIHNTILEGQVELGKSGKSIETEMTISNTIYSLLSSPVKGQNYINIYGRDITKRKLLEIELKRLALIARETENAVILSNNTGEIEWVNEAFTKISEYLPEEVLGRKPAEFLVGPETDMSVVDKIAEAIQNRQALEIDVINYTKSKKKYWIKLQIQPVFGLNGELENYISIQKEITKEKEIEQELIKTTNFQKAILKSSAIAIISTNLEGIIQSFNPAACSMFGYQASEVIGSSTPVLFHDKSEIFREFKKIGDQRICYFGVCESVGQPEININSDVKELTCIHKNGNRFPVSLTVTALRDEHNVVTGFLGMATDTTERQKQIEALQIANLRFRSLISSLQAAVMVEDENRKIILVNQYFCDLFNIPLIPEQLVGYECANAAEESKYLFADSEQFIKEIENTLKEYKIVTNLELQMVNGKSLERDFIPLEDSEQKNHGILWIYRDITARKKNELDLKRQSLILSGTAQAMNYLLTLHDHDQAIQKALETIGLAIGVDRVYIFENTEDPETGEAYFSQQFEWTAHGIVPQIGNMELQNMSYSKNFPEWYNTLKSGHTVSGLRESFPENERLIFEDQDIKSIIAAPIFVRDQLWGMVGFDDCTVGIEWSQNELSIITALAGSIGGSISKRIIEEELIGARHIAEYATKTKSDFLATMSHEIRTPMNGVIGMTSLLMQTQLSQDQRDYAETIKVSGELLLDVINDILDFSKIESGKMILEEHHFDLRLAIEDVLDLMATSVYEKKIGLYFDVDPIIPVRIRGDLTRLRQILVNLAGNAVKFTSRGEVVISVKQTERHGETFTLEFIVKDTGVGIPKDKIDLLFKPFSQVDASTTRKFGGTGLGLAICAKLVGLMHGKIWVKSEVGKGTEFIFTIQTHYQNKEEDNKEQLAIKEILREKKVLIVDSNPTQSKIVNALLTNREMVTIPVNSIQLARLIQYSTKELDLILFDSNLPENELFSFVSEIRSSPGIKDIPMILISDPATAERMSAFDNHFQSKINKPLKQSQLITTIRSLLSKSLQLKSPIINQPSPIPKMNITHPLNILVAEDNAINQKLIARLFEMLGYKIHIAANGFEVIEALKRMKIDIIFMDIQMPEMDGLEATRKIIEQWGVQKPLIVAMTANALYSDKDKCLAAGMDDYISKPLTINQVKNGIERWAPLCTSNY